MQTKENVKTTNKAFNQVKSLDYESKVKLEELIKKNLAPYLATVNCTSPKLSDAYFSIKHQTQWFGFMAQCPVCHNDNTTGFCLVGIDIHSYKISFLCKRPTKAEPYIQTDTNNKKHYIVVPMGKDKNGKDVSDIYVMTDQYADCTYWGRDANKSQSELVGLKGGLNIKTKPVKLAEKEAPSGVQDIMNRFVLAKYKLSPKNYENLKHRGFTDEDLKTFRKGTSFGTLTKWKVRQYDDYLYQRKGNPYFSLWQRALGMNADVLAKMGYSQKQIDKFWYGVPGFYLKPVKRDGKKVYVPCLNVQFNGMLVPFYNTFNEVIRFQVRVDEPFLKHTSVTKEDKQGFDFDRDGYDITTFFYSKNAKIDGKRQDKSGRSFKTYIFYKNAVKPEKVIATGRVHKLNQWIDLTKALHEAGFKDKSYRFQANGKADQKYFWVSSSNMNDEKAGGIYGVKPKYGTPVEVAYQPKIATLSPNSKELAEYRQKPKNVWVTEGGLKALLAVRKLENHFTSQQLDLYGHDVLGVPGVESTKQLKPILEELNVQNVTLAFDMDMFTENNSNVSNSLYKLADDLISNGYGVRIAVWNGNVGKGIDDILVTNQCYMKFMDLKIKKVNED